MGNGIVVKLLLESSPLSFPPLIALFLLLSTSLKLTRARHYFFMAPFLTTLLPRQSLEHEHEDESDENDDDEDEDENDGRRWTGRRLNCAPKTKERGWQA